eukprot:scaffold448960_cov48-Prasinocladus_malaysianus.AAC.1
MALSACELRPSCSSLDGSDLDAADDLVGGRPEVADEEHALAVLGEAADLEEREGQPDVGLDVVHKVKAEGVDAPAQVGLPAHVVGV